MIRQVHAHPHEISIFAGGPLTDVALAVRMDPEFASIVKELVFLGAVRPPTSPDFNTRFDPEASRIVLGAHLPSITAVCALTYYITLDKADIDKIFAAQSPIGDFVVRYFGLDVGKTNLWAVRLDPSNALIQGQSKLCIVNAIDVCRFKSLFVAKNSSSEMARLAG